MARSLALALLAAASSASAQCNTPSWQTLSYPGSRANHAAAFDPVSGRTIALGGVRGTTALNEAVAWDGAQWATLPSGPSARSYPVMVWDSQRQCAVVFGGLSATNAPLGDTWEWSGSAWTQRTAPGPSARSGAGHAFDSARGQTVLFGGAAAGGPQADTWLWDGAAWVNSGAAGPSARSHPGMVYDAAAGRVVLFGGVDSAGVRQADTWLWDGAAWARAQVPGPPARSHFGMAYDEDRQRVVLFGGLGAGSLRLSDTWEWDGAAWSQVPAPGPTPRGSHTLTYDSARGRCVLIEGSGASAAVWTSDTWEFDGASWRLVASAVPANATGRPLVGQGDGPCLAFGGYRAAPAVPAGVNNETWEWTGLVWKRLPVAGPPARCYSGLAYDAARDRTVLFGGATNITGGSYFGDTWEFDGAAWTQRAIAGPPARSNPGITFDESSGRVILFGGFTGSTYASDTWAYDGTGWTQLAAGGPPGRSGHAMAYDQHRQRVVMYGGFSGSVFLSDTWELTGDTWTLVSVSGPGPRTAFVMGYDPFRRRTVLYGGSTGSGFVRETWEWDGALWTRTAQSGPIPNVAGGLAWDSARNRLVCASNVSAAGLPAIMAVYDADTLPAVSAQPVPVAINAGQTGNFLVAALSASPMSYHWRRDAQPLTDGPTASGSVISGAASPSLSIVSAQAGDAGHYDCIITNACGGIASASAELIILCSTPVVTLQPVDQIVENTQSAEFTTAASGTDPLAYQWRRAGTPLINGVTASGSTISGSATSVLTIRGVRDGDAGAYDCVVTNACGSAVSAAARLSVRCYANCDGSTTPPVLNVNDLVCFMTRYAAGDPWANCSTADSRRAPRAADFLCFLEHYRAGCPESYSPPESSSCPPHKGKGSQAPLPKKPQKAEPHKAAPPTCPPQKTAPPKAAPKKDEPKKAAPRGRAR